ncbi:hypothetical protein BDY21DRAFT_299125 [Lineolata rhizophorae]|uniref:Uncharacterized protein n=1 Tax=Lineolata rhizophorae TaxID=578093 RepID=A0A6A6P7G2_9PEZI|nr:hypothetical protein BDY21DRAFT_299125 [Lineolata rhizophorae]
MAAPESVTINDLTGKWVINKSLSGDTDAVLALQGMGWLMRQTLKLATVTVGLRQYADSAGVTHVDAAQTLTGGIPGTTERRVLDWRWREHADHIFGELRGRSRFCDLGRDLGDGAAGPEEDREFLRAGWGREMRAEGGKAIESFVENEKAGWTGWQVWGFEDDVKANGEDGPGERRYVRHVVVRKGEEAVRIKMIYDYIGRE